MNCISPSTLTFVTTYQCTAACTNCCFQCSPKRKGKLKFSDIKDIIEMGLNSLPTIRLVVFTGGEPFLLGEDLLKSVKLAAKKGLSTRIVSNAFWAKDYNTAFKVLQEFKDAGLNEINYSTGDEHQEFVSVDHVVNACLSALDLSIPVAVNVEAHETKTFQANELRNDKRLRKYKNSPLFKVGSGSWKPISEESKKIYSKFYTPEAEKKHIGSNVKGCDTIFNNISITPNKKLLSCCGFCADKIPYLQFGSIYEGNIYQNFTSQFDDLLKLWLFVSGPHEIAEYINKYKSENNKLITANRHSCDICEEIYSKEEHLDVIRQNFHSLYPNIYFKYQYQLELNKKNKMP